MFNSNFYSIENKNYLFNQLSFTLSLAEKLKIQGIDSLYNFALGEASIYLDFLSDFSDLSDEELLIFSNAFDLIYRR